MTIEEKLEKYKDKNLSFAEAYSDCEPIENVEGEIFEDATYSGYCLTSKHGEKYFTDYGIRGISRGTFFIYNGEPKDIINAPGFELEHYFCKLISNMPELKDTGLTLYSVKAFLRKNWFEYQIEKIKNNEAI